MNIRKATFALYSYQTANKSRFILKNVGSISVIIVTVCYLLAVLSLPLQEPGHIIWFAIYPMLMAPMVNLTYLSLLGKSLYILPVLVIIGIFNPLYDTETAFFIGNLNITFGWLTFFSILLRGILCFQALIIMIRFSGYIEFCATLRKIGIPKVIATQLYLTYRYIGVLLEEASAVHISSVSRGYGKKSFPVRIWVSLVGSLLLRTFERSRRLHLAMLSRGYNGDFTISDKHVWNSTDTFFILVWPACFSLIYFINPSRFFN